MESAGEPQFGHSGARAQPGSPEPRNTEVRLSGMAGVHRFRAWPGGPSRNDGKAIQFRTSLEMGRLLRGPPADQPPMMPENMPASPPARTRKRPPGRNLLTVLPVSEGGPPSAMPLAPATRSAPGISHSR